VLEFPFLETANPSIGNYQLLPRKYPSMVIDTVLNQAYNHCKKLHFKLIGSYLAKPTKHSFCGVEQGGYSINVREESRL
jgi:hypothetical protein